MECLENKFLKLNSNDGYSVWELMICRCTESQVVCDIGIRNSFFSKELSQSTNLVDFNHFKLKNVFINISAIKSCKLQFSKWLDSEFLFECQLLNENGRSVFVSLGVNENFICSKSKPYFQFCITDFRVNFTSGFIVDQSCVKLFIESIEKTLSI